MMHSTHFIYNYIGVEHMVKTLLRYHPHKRDSTYHSLCYYSCTALVRINEGNVLFNDTLFPISSNFFFQYASSHRQDNTYHGLCYTSRGELAEMYVCMYVKVK